MSFREKTGEICERIHMQYHSNLGSKRGSDLQNVWILGIISVILHDIHTQGIST